MRRAAPVLLCLVLLSACVCPAFCLSQASHSCCHPKQTGKTITSCGHALPAQHELAVTAAPATIGIRIQPVAVNLPPAPRPVQPRIQKLCSILRL